MRINLFQIISICLVFSAYYSYAGTVSEENSSAEIYLAKKAFHNKNYQDALTLIEEMSKNHQNSREVAYLRARCNVELKNFELAEAELKKIIAESSNFEPAYISLGTLYIKYRPKETTEQPLLEWLDSNEPIKRTTAREILRFMLSNEQKSALKVSKEKPG